MVTIKYAGPFLPSSHYERRPDLREETSAGSVTSTEWSLVGK
jgi:hypothetical protein